MQTIRYNENLGLECDKMPHPRFSSEVFRRSKFKQILIYVAFVTKRQKPLLYCNKGFVLGVIYNGCGKLFLLNIHLNSVAVCLDDVDTLS